MNDTIHSGSCLCGEVRFEAAEPLRNFVACHCSQCRKQSGHFPAFTNVALERFSLTRRDGLRWYRASPHAERGFCGTCGSLLFWRGEGKGHISIAGGAFDGSTGRRLVTHIYCEDKAHYYDIDDSAAKFPQDNTRP